jgi:uncharacterized membrane protein YbhN (UPF0104 family)
VYARRIDWDDVLNASLQALPVPALGAAVGLAVASHLLYSCFDLIGRRYTGHTLKTGIVMMVNFVSYAFNLCIGLVVGGVGFRYRLYSRLGLKTGVITRIVSMSMLTNWLGYKLLAGLLFLIHPLAAAAVWHMGNHGLRVHRRRVLVAISAAAYLIACWRWRATTWTCAATSCTCPRLRMACCRWPSRASTGA